MKSNTKYINDRWLNRDWEYLAIRQNGKWEYYIRMDKIQHKQI